MLQSGDELTPTTYTLKALYVITSQARHPHYLPSVREGKATIVTGHINTLTETGIEMKSGEKVEADFTDFVKSHMVETPS